MILWEGLTQSLEMLEERKRRKRRRRIYRRSLISVFFRVYLCSFITVRQRNSGGRSGRGGNCEERERERDIVRIETMGGRKQYRKLRKKGH